MRFLFIIFISILLSALVATGIGSLSGELINRLQVRGSFTEVVSQIPQKELQPYIGERVISKYLTAQEEGRL